MVLWSLGDWKKVGTGMVCHGSGMVTAQEFHHVLPERRWYTKASHPICPESLSDHVRGSAGQRNHFWPMRESVNTSEKMGVTIDCGKQTNQVYMNMGKPRVRRAEVANWRHGVYVHFGPLAGQAGTSPLACVSIHVGPDILGSHQLLCGTNSKMLKTMELCEELKA